MNLHQPVKDPVTQSYTTPACFALERLSQPAASCFSLSRKAPDVSPCLRIQRFLPCCWKSLHKVHGKGKGDFWSSVGASGHCPKPSRAFTLLFQHKFYLIWLCTSWNNPGPNCPSPAGFVPHQGNPRVLSPKFSTAEKAPGSSYDSTLKTAWWIFWGGNREWSLVHRRIHYIPFLRLFCSALSQH